MVHAMVRYLLIFSVVISLQQLCTSYYAYADTMEELYKERLALYKKTEAISYVPWYYLAAIDQYERNKQDNSAEDESLISIEFVHEEWFGIGNISLDASI